MNALFQVRIVVYSVDARKIAITSAELPILSIGSYFIHKEITLRVDSMVYDTDTKIMVYMCGYLVQSIAGNADGFILHFPYGHISKDIFENHFSDWKIVDEEDLDEIFHSPMISVLLPEFKNVTYTN